ncbi:MAG: aminotransferase class IV family protein [Hyphomicrobiales bacterium]
MPAQGPVPHRELDDFGLIETMLWTATEGIALLPYHMARLARSSKALEFRHDQAAVDAAIASAIAAEQPATRLRVRLVAHPDGRVKATAQPEAPVAPGTIWKVAIARTRLDPDDPLIHHKTTRRAHYDDERVRLKREQGADEALFLNERGDICEGSITTVFAERHGTLYTPPAELGLLPGVLRESLLDLGRAHAHPITYEDLKRGFFVGNAVRGLIRAALLSTD